MSEASDNTNAAPETPVDELEALKAQLQAAEKDRDDYLAQAKRVRADFENYQKRVQRDAAQEKLYAVYGFAADVLPALDNLERALNAAKQAGDNGPLAQGVGLVQNLLLDILKRHGITRIDAQDKPFDPNLHQAVMQMPVADKPPMTVVQVLESGYQMHERVLRPARVAVSTAATDKPV